MNRYLLLTSLVFGLTFAACGDSDDGSSSRPSGSRSGPVGNWSLDMDALIAINEDKMRTEAEDQGLAGENLDMKLKQSAAMLKTMEMRCGFTDDGKCWMEAKMMGQVQPRKTGTWKMDGDKVLITPDPGSEGEDEEVPPLIYKDGKLTVPTGDVTLPLKRS